MLNFFFTLMLLEQLQSLSRISWSSFLEKNGPRDFILASKPEMASIIKFAQDRMWTFWDSAIRLESHPWSRNMIMKTDGLLATRVCLQLSNSLQYNHHYFQKMEAWGVKNQNPRIIIKLCNSQGMFFPIYVLLVTRYELST